MSPGASASTAAAAAGSSPVLPSAALPPLVVGGGCPFPQGEQKGVVPGPMPPPAPQDGGMGNGALHLSLRHI